MGWGIGSQQRREKHITVKAITKMKLRRMNQCTASETQGCSWKEMERGGRAQEWGQIISCRCGKPLQQTPLIPCLCKTTDQVQRSGLKEARIKKSGPRTQLIPTLIRLHCISSYLPNVHTLTVFIQLHEVTISSFYR